MFVITGITGKVGGKVAETLIAKGYPVRAVVRNESKGAHLKDMGCELAVVADASDEAAMTKAFAGATGVFLLNPPNYDPTPGFTEVHKSANAATNAIKNARPGKVVFLSSVGAHVNEFNLLNNAGIYEMALLGCDVPVVMLRPAWFMENAAWDVTAARYGYINSFLQPLDRPIDMVSTQDIGQTAADLLLDEWVGVRIVELKGPQTVSPNEIAAGFALALGHPVIASAVNRNTWEEKFRDEGMQNPQARIRMLDGFNEGWLTFQRKFTELRTGTTTLQSVLGELVTKAN